jgi:hypothetical protein
MPTAPSISTSNPLPLPDDGQVVVDRLTRLKQVVAFRCAPRDLPFLVAHLASDAGQIDCQISGKTLKDQLGSERKQLRCIISGWFDVLDSSSLMPVKFDVDIDSRVRLFESEEALPPLEDEPEDEDFVVCGDRFDVIAHVQEEILLALPVNTPLALAASAEQLPKGMRHKAAMAGSSSGRSPKDDRAGSSAGAIVPKVAAFAKLAALKGRVR